MSISILIAEDDALLRSLVAEILSLQPEFQVLGNAGDGEEALAKAGALQPDILLLDLSLPGVSGLKVLEQIGAWPQKPSVLVLSGDESEETQLQAAGAGAMGFLGKSRAMAVLPDAIRAVARGEAWFSRQVSARIFGAYSRLIQQVREQEQPLHLLTEREKEVLAQVARGLTNQQIAAELLMSVSTVKTHIQSIFQKLGLPNRTEAAVFAVREGLLADPPAPGR